MPGVLQTSSALLQYDNLTFRKVGGLGGRYPVISACRYLISINKGRLIEWVFKDVRCFAGSETRPFAQHHLSDLSYFFTRQPNLNILKAAHELFSLL